MYKVKIFDPPDFNHGRDPSPLLPDGTVVHLPLPRVAVRLPLHDVRRRNRLARNPPLKI